MMYITEIYYKPLMNGILGVCCTFAHTGLRLSAAIIVYSWAIYECIAFSIMSALPRQALIKVLQYMCYDLAESVGSREH